MKKIFLLLIFCTKIYCFDECLDILREADEIYLDTKISSKKGTKKERLKALRNSTAEYRKAADLFLQAIDKKCSDHEYTVSQLSYCLKDWGLALIDIYEETFNNAYVDKLIKFLYEWPYTLRMDEKLKDFLDIYCQRIIPEN